MVASSPGPASVASNTSSTGPRLKSKIYVRTLDCVLLTPLSMIARPKKSTSKTSSVTALSTSPAPLGRGHRTKRPSARFVSASQLLLENDNTDSEAYPTMPKTPRQPLQKKSRRTKSDGDGDGIRIWCHQCHQDRSQERTHRCQACGKSYCAGCLMRR